MQSQNTFEFGHRTMRHIRRAAIAGALIVSVLPAQASPVTGTLSFTASGFPTGAPNDPVTGAVRFSFDNTASVVSGLHPSPRSTGDSGTQGVES